MKRNYLKLIKFILCIIISCDISAAITRSTAKKAKLAEHNAVVFLSDIGLPIDLQNIIFDYAEHYENGYLIGSHDTMVCDLVFLSKNILASTSQTDTRIWNIKTGKCLKVFKGFSQTLASLTEKIDGVSLLALSSKIEDPTIDILNTKSGRKLKSFNSGHNFEGIAKLAVLSNGLLVSSGVGEVKVWNSDYTIKSTLKLSPGSAAFVLLELPENKLISAGMDKQITIWDIGTSQKLKEIPVGEMILSGVILQNGFLAVGLNNGHILIIDIQTGKVIKKFGIKAPNCLYYLYAVFCLEKLPNGNLVAATKNILKIWDKNDYKLLYQLKCPTKIQSLAISNDGDIYAGLENHDDKIDGQIVVFNNHANEIKTYF